MTDSLRGQLAQLEAETFEIDDLPGTSQNLASGTTSSSTSCSSTTSCSTTCSSCCSSSSSSCSSFT